MHRTLYCIRNVGKKRALRRSVLETPAIEVAFVMPANAKELEEYTGFTEKEVKELCDRFGYPIKKLWGSLRHP